MSLPHVCLKFYFPFIQEIFSWHEDKRTTVGSEDEQVVGISVLLLGFCVLETSKVCIIISYACFHNFSME